MKLTVRQRELLKQAEYCGGETFADGLRENHTARTLEKRGLIRLGFHSEVIITSAGRAALEQGGGE